MSEKTTTSNGHEIKNPTSEMTADRLRQKLEEWGIDGENPASRIEQFKHLSVEGIAIVIDEINKSLQGSQDSLMNHETVVKIGSQETLKPELRYDVFKQLIDDIRQCPDTVNPARIGDVLALGVVLLHPFRDGNGRTARVLGLIFRDDYDKADYSSTYDVVTESRDTSRARGGMIVYGYTPQFPEGFDQTNPVEVSAYLAGLLREENTGLYVGPYGQAPRSVEHSPENNT